MRLTRPFRPLASCTYSSGADRDRAGDQRPDLLFGEPLVERRFA